MAIKASRNRGWEAYRSIERFSADGQRCRRRQILDHFGDRAQGAPTGRCCDVCDPDGALERVLQAPLASTSRSRRPGGGGRGGGGRASAQVEEDLEPVDEREFEELRAWRMERAEGKPAFTVATDTVLRALLRKRPENVSELLEVKGIGPAFCEKHGESLLAVLGSGPTV